MRTPPGTRAWGASPSGMNVAQSCTRKARADVAFNRASSQLLSDGLLGLRPAWALFMERSLFKPVGTASDPGH